MQHQKAPDSESTIGQDSGDMGPEPDESGFNDRSSDGEVEPGDIDGSDVGDPSNSDETRSEDPRF